MAALRKRPRSGPLLASLAAAGLTLATLAAAPAFAHPAATVPTHSAASVAPVTAPTVVVDEDFAQQTTLPAGWNTFGGNWVVQDGALKQTQESGTPILTFGDHLNDFQFDATMTFDSGSNDTRWVALGLDMNPAGKAPWAQAAMRKVTNTADGLEFANELDTGHFVVPAQGKAPVSMADGSQVNVSVVVHGSKGVWNFNGQQIFTTDSVQRTANGVFGLVMNAATASFQHIKITQLPSAPLVTLVQPGQTGLVIGHRGDPIAAPEDTLISEVQENLLGGDFMEFDLHMTKDGVPVVMHDGTVDRTTDGTGNISDMTLAQIEALDAGSWFSPVYAGIKVPTFEDILKYASANGGNILPEFKDSGWTQAEVQTVIDLINKYNMGSRTMFQSFTVPPLQLAEQIDPNIARAGLLSAPLPADPVAYTKQFDGQALLPSFDTVTPALVKTMHAAGIAVVTWTTDSPTDWARLTADGVDGIMSNTPGTLLGWVQRYNQAPATSTPTAPLAFVAPTADAKVTGTVPVSVTVSGQNLQAYNLRVDNTGLQYVPSPKPGTETFNLDTTTLTNGVHTLLATTADATGNKPAVTEKITVNNAPALSFVTPSADATAAGTVPVKVTLSGQGLRAYNLRVDNTGLQYAAAATAGAQAFNLDTTTLANGVHTLQATATDSAGNKTTATEKVTINN